MKVVLILQARMGSTRMPGKVLSELVEGKTLLSCLLDRLKQSRTATEIVIATTDLSKDDALVEFARQQSVRVFRGSEADVLSRFVGAAGNERDTTIVRLCADSPLLDAEVIDICVTEYLQKRNQVDYVSNMHPESFPYGMAVEVFSLDVLWRLDRMTMQPELREHVTSLVYHQPSLFATANVEHATDLSAYRFAVDYPEDFAFAKAIYERLYASNALFGWRSVIDLLQKDRLLLEINASRNERLQLVRSL